MALLLRAERRALGSLLLRAAVLVSGACADDGVSADALRFGQSGEVQVQVITPLMLGAGELRQLVRWRSSGEWQLFESISYRGLVGDESRRSSRGDAAAYAEFIAQINQNPALTLFIHELDASLVPDCDPGTATVIVTVYDAPRNERREWRRCGRGPLDVLTPEGAGPDPAASRVLNAAQLVRDFALQAHGRFISAYAVSLPFGTLDRGSNSRSGLKSSLVLLPDAGADSTGHEPPEWRSFWRAHSGSQEAPPAVDWTREMVLYVAYGERFEAGDSIEVRQIKPVANGTQIEVWRIVPGDFCAPAARTHTPFHLVVAPLTATPIRFDELRIERVPCGP